MNRFSSAPFARSGFAIAAALQLAISGPVFATQKAKAASSESQAPLRLYVSLSEPLPFDLPRLLELLRVELGGRPIALVPAAPVTGAAESPFFSLAVVSRGDSGKGRESLSIAVFDAGNWQRPSRNVDLLDVDLTVRSRTLALAISEMVPAHDASHGAFDEETTREESNSEPTVNQPVTAVPPARAASTPASLATARSRAGGSEADRGVRFFGALSGVARSYPSGRVALLGPELSSCMGVSRRLEVCADAGIGFGLGGLYLADANGAADNVALSFASVGVSPRLTTGGRDPFSLGLRLSAGRARFAAKGTRLDRNALVEHASLIGQLRRAFDERWSGLLTMELGYTLRGLSVESLEANGNPGPASLAMSGVFASVALGVALDLHGGRRDAGP